MALPWYRVYCGMPDNRRLRLAAEQAGQPVAIALAVWITCLDHAAQQDDRGSLSGLDHRLIAVALQVPAETVAGVLDAFEAAGLTCAGRVANWSARQPQREDGSAERARAWRERQKSNGSEPDRMDSNATERNRTHANAPDRESEEDQDIDLTTTAASSGDAPRAHAHAREAVTGDALELIAAFDASRVATWGPEIGDRRGHRDDARIAADWVRAGLTVCEARHVCDAVFAKLKAKGHDPRFALKSLDGDVRSFLRAKAESRAPPRMN